MNPNAFVGLINKKKKFFGIKYFDFLERKKEKRYFVNE